MSIQRIWKYFTLNMLHIPHDENVHRNYLYFLRFRKKEVYINVFNDITDFRLLVIPGSSLSLKASIYAPV